MTISVTSSFPTSNDTFPTVSGASTLGAAEHSNLHNLTFSALSALQTHLGRSNTYTATGDLAWNTSAIITMGRLATAITGVRSAIGSTSDSSAVSSVYGAIATVQGRVGTTADATTATTAHGKINKINTTIGASTDTYTASTVYGAIASARKLTTDLVGSPSDSSSMSTVYGNLAKKLNTTGGTITGAVDFNGATSVNGGGLTVDVDPLYSQGLVISLAGTTQMAFGPGAVFNVSPMVPTATASGAAVPKSQMDTALAAKQDKPGTGQAMLRFTAGQSADPVTVWLGNNPSALTSNPPVTDGNHTGGSNIQLQWNSSRSMLRYHIDARTNVAGQNGTVGAGAVYHDIAPARTVKPATWPDATTAVMTHGTNEMGLVWYLNSPYLSVDTTIVGALAFQSPSSQRFKTIDNSVVPDYLGFLKAVNVVRFTYKDEDVVGSQVAGQTHVGFIAENVAQAAALNNIPDDVVIYDAQGLPTGISDRDMTAVLWKIVQDLTRDTPAS